MKQPSRQEFLVPLSPSLARSNTPVAAAGRSILRACFVLRMGHVVAFWCVHRAWRLLWLQRHRETKTAPPNLSFSHAKPAIDTTENFEFQLNDRCYRIQGSPSVRGLDGCCLQNHALRWTHQHLYWEREDGLSIYTIQSNLVNGSSLDPMHSYDVLVDDLLNLKPDHFQGYG